MTQHSSVVKCHMNCMKNRDCGAAVLTTTNYCYVYSRSSLAKAYMLPSFRDQVYLPTRCNDTACNNFHSINAEQIISFDKPNPINESLGRHEGMSVGTCLPQSGPTSFSQVCRSLYTTNTLFTCMMSSSNAARRYDDGCLSCVTSSLFVACTFMAQDADATTACSSAVSTHVGVL